MNAILTGFLAAVAASASAPGGEEPAYQALVREGQGLYAQGRCEEALGSFETAIAAGARGGELFYQTAFCYRAARQDSARSQESLSKAAALLEESFASGEPSGPGPYYYLSAVRRELGRTAESTAVCRKGIAVAEAGGFAHVRDGPSLFQIARLYSLAGQKEPAIAWYEKAVSAMTAGPESSRQELPLALRELAAWHGEQGRYHESAGWYTRLLEAEAVPETERFAAGLIMVRAGQYDEALATLVGFTDDDLATEANYVSRVISRYMSLGTAPPGPELVGMDEAGLQQAIQEAATRFGGVIKREDEDRARQEAQAGEKKLQEAPGQRWPRKAGGTPPVEIIKSTDPPSPPSEELLAAEREFFGLLAERLRRGLPLRNLALANGYARLIFR